MAMSMHNDVLDGMLDVIATGTEIKVCDTEPTDYTEADATYMLAKTTVFSGDGGGDWTIADGDVTGRKITLAEQAGVSITKSGTAQHIAICTASVLLAVVTLTASQALTAGNTVTIPAFDITNNDPT